MSTFKYPFFIVLFLLVFLCCLNANAQTISTIAGNGVQGSAGDGGLATSAQLFVPASVAVDAYGNKYIADTWNNKIRKINKNGIISTFAGTGNNGFSGDGGKATLAQLNGPNSVALDSKGNVFISDGNNFCIRKVDIAGNITTVAGGGTLGLGDGGLATSAQLAFPNAIQVDSIGNIYIADWSDQRIRKVDTYGIITTIAGNSTAGYSGDGGLATKATINYPACIAIDNSGNLLFTDYQNSVIRKIDKNGIISTIAGNGTYSYTGDGGLATNAGLNSPYGIAIDLKGNIYFSDELNYCIRKIDTNGKISTVVGNGSYGYGGDGGNASSAMLESPYGLCFDAEGNLYIADHDNNRIRKVTYSNPLSITSFSPTTASNGSTVFIKGSGFTGTYAVSFGGVAALSFSVIDDNTISAIIGNGASGSITVANIDSSKSIVGFNYCTQVTPSISITASATSICEGSSVTFSATSINGGSSPMYQWKKNGTIISSVTDPSYTYSPTNNDVIVCVLTANNVCQTANSANSNTITETVSTNVTPSVVLTASPSGTICSGTAVTFSATPTNGGLSPAYQWKKNGIAISGATASTYSTTSLINNDAITCLLTSNASCFVSNTASSNSIVIAVNGINNSWTGATNTNWATGSNWCSGVVPASNVDIIIPVVSSKNYPVLSSNLTLSGNLTVSAGTTLSLNGYTLTLTGALTGTGYLKGSSTSSLAINSTSKPTLYFNQSATDTLLNTLTIAGSGGAILGSGIGITNLLNLNASNLNLNGNHLTLKSTSITNTAVVGPVTNGATISGSITVERFIPKGYKGFRELSTGGVSNAGSIFNNWQEAGRYTSGYGLFITGKANKTAGFDANTGLDYTSAGNLDAFNYLNYNTWSAINNPKNTNLDPYTGYHVCIYGDRATNLFASKFDSSKLMPTATTIRTTGQLVSGTVTYSSTGVTGGYNSTVTKILSLKDTGSFIANPYPCAIDWESIVAASSGLTTSYYYFEPTFLTASGYQTFVSYNATSHTNSIPVSSKVNRYIQPGQSFWIQTNHTAGATRQLVISEVNKVTNFSNLTAIFGVNKSYSQLAVSLWRDVEGIGNTVVDGVVAVFDNSFSLNYGDEDTRKMQNEKENIAINEALAGNLAIDGVPLPQEGAAIKLKLSNLKANKTYRMQFDGSYLNSSNTLQPYLVDAFFHTQTPITGSNFIYSFTVDSSNADYDDRFSISFKSVTNTPIVSIPTSGKISVFPNPVKGKLLNIKLSNVASGNYILCLYSVLGKEVYSKSINYNQGAQNYFLPLSNEIAAGAYTLKVVLKGQVANMTTVIIQ